MSPGHYNDDDYQVEPECMCGAYKQINGHHMGSCPMMSTVEEMKKMSPVMQDPEQTKFEVEVRVGESSVKFEVDDNLLTRPFADRNQDWASIKASTAFTNAYMQEAERTGKRRPRRHDPVSHMEVKEEEQNYGEQ
jgi:hypothetical protein